jgi:AcrR family transcriptional regulator
MTNRLSPSIRTDQLLDAALALATTHGWASLTRDAIAAAADVSGGLVTQRLGTMDQIRRSVMRRAVQRRVVRVVAEGLVARDPRAGKADDALRAECAALMGRS